MARNLYSAFLELQPAKLRQIATVTAIDGDIAQLVLPGGGVLTALGVGQRVIGAEVFVRDGVIEGDAPADMPLVQFEI